MRREEFRPQLRQPGRRSAGPHGRLVLVQPTLPLAVLQVHLGQALRGLGAVLRAAGGEAGRGVHALRIEGRGLPGHADVRRRFGPLGLERRAQGAFGLLQGHAFLVGGERRVALDLHACQQVLVHGRILGEQGLVFIRLEGRHAHLLARGQRQPQGVGIAQIGRRLQPPERHAVVHVAVGQCQGARLDLRREELADQALQPCFEQARLGRFARRAQQSLQRVAQAGAQQRIATGGGHGRRGGVPHCRRGRAPGGGACGHARDGCGACRAGRLLRRTAARPPQQGGRGGKAARHQRRAADAYHKPAFLRRLAWSR